MRRSTTLSLFALGCFGGVWSTGCNYTRFDDNCAFSREVCGAMDASSDAMTVQDGSTSIVDGSSFDGGGSDATVHDAGSDSGAHKDGSVVDGAPGDSGSDTGPSCDAGLSYCTGFGCIPLDTTDNCGGCGTTCPVPSGGSAACVENDAGSGYTCSETCSTLADTFCGMDAGCVALSSSPTNCGTCGHACVVPTNGASNTCNNSGCVLTCESGYHTCFGNCDSNNDVPSDAAINDPCVVSNAFGVFVAPAGSSAGDGGMGAPYSNIVQAMTAAKAAGKRVYACAGTYPTQTVAVTSAVDGVTVYGGLNCASPDDAGAWPWTGSPSIVPSASNSPALTVGSLSSGVEFDDFSFTASDAPSTAGGGAGSSSIAAIVSSGSGPVTFRRVVFGAGAGQPGASGSNGTAYSATATTGNNDVSGNGATETVCSCGAANVSGGGGGTPGTDERDGGVLYIVTASGSGQAGFPQALSSNAGPGVTSGAPNCNPGNPGVNGDAGPGAVGATGHGSLSAGGLTPPGQASSGTVGGPAQGGGGAGGFFHQVTSATVTGGGGGGGCGGCGGPNGTGGYAGGASIGLVVVSSPVTLDACTFNRSNGGIGGAGGNGVAGQTGGSAGNSSDTNSGCSGGNGGTGGTGGAGGGGVGGHSLGIAYTGSFTPPSTINGTGGSAGAGGAAGSGSPPTSGSGQGAAGVATGSLAL